MEYEYRVIFLKERPNFPILERSVLEKGSFHREWSRVSEKEKPNFGGSIHIGEWKDSNDEIISKIIYPLQ